MIELKNTPIKQNNAFIGFFDNITPKLNNKIKVGINMYKTTSQKKYRVEVKLISNVLILTKLNAITNVLIHNITAGTKKCFVIE